VDPVTSARLSRPGRVGSATLTSVVSVAVGLALWQAASLWVDVGILFPTFTATVARLLGLLRGADPVYGSLPAHVLASLGRVAAGFAIGSALGAAVGLVAGAVTPVRRLLEPHINFFRFVTPVAWISPAIVWFGIGETSKVFLIVYTTVFIVLVNTMVGVTHVARDRVRMARSFGAGPLQLFALIVLPSTVPFVLTGMRIAMGNSIATIVAAEMVAAREGVGYLIFFSRSYQGTDVMFAALLTLGAMGFVADRMFVAGNRLLLGRFQPE
jgi:ABC-type nitrate/sulfonate/bicarbonate transport system permease component